MSILMNRRTLVRALSATGALAVMPSSLRATAKSAILKKAIPSTGTLLPVIGMGSWINFNVGQDTVLRKERAKVLKAFFEGGGAMIDSSPMYGSSEEVIGYMLRQLAYPNALFATTKIWTSFEAQGLKQVKRSMDLWGVKKFQLLQVHNLVAWQAHLKLLKDLKEQGLVEYIGITTSHGRRHDEFAAIMKTETLDFVQLTYNIDNRTAENSLLSLAQDRGIAVIANRPFARGTLIDRYERHPLPEFAKEIECANWAQFLLKFTISHPAINVAIPATTRVDHVKENMGAAFGRLPDEKMRNEMANYCASLK